MKLLKERIIVRPAQLFWVESEQQVFLSSRFSFPSLGGMERAKVIGYLIGSLIENSEWVD